MTRTILVSNKVTAEFGPRLDRMLSAMPDLRGEQAIIIGTGFIGGNIVDEAALANYVQGLELENEATKN